MRAPTRNQRRTGTQGNIALLIPLIVVIVGGSFMMSDSFKGHQMVATSEQNKMEATRIARAFYQEVVRPSLEARIVNVGQPIADQCPELSAFKVLGQQPKDQTFLWTAASLPAQWCGITLAQVMDTSRIEALKLDVRRETADSDMLSTVLHVNIVVETKKIKGKPGGRADFIRRLMMRAPRLADFSLIMKRLPDSEKAKDDRFKVSHQISRVEVRGPVLFDALGQTPTLGELTDETKKADPKLIFYKATLRGSMAVKAEEGKPTDLTSFFKVFPAGVTQRFMEEAHMPYEDPSPQNPTQFRGPFSVQYDYSARTLSAPPLPLVGYGNLTSKVGPAPGGQGFSMANAIDAYNLPVTQTPHGFAIPLNETCSPSPSNAPLVVNSAEGRTVEIDFKDGGTRFCGFINTDILRVKVSADGDVNVLVGTFMARKIEILGRGGLIIAHPRSVVPVGGAATWPGQKEAQWPFAAADTYSHFNRLSGTTANPYFKPLYVPADYDAVRAAYKPMHPHEMGENNKPMGYFEPVPPLGPVLYPVPVVTPISNGAINEREWRGMIFHLEQIL